MRWLFASVLALVPILADPAEILVLMPLPGYSHTMPFMPIFKELGRRGHNLTMITPFPQDPTPKGFHQIKVEMNIDEVNKVIFDFVGSKPSAKESAGLGSQVAVQILFLAPICKYLTPLFMERLKHHLPPASTHYDLIIMEPYFCMESLIGAGHVYNAPVIATLPMLPTPNVAAPMGLPDSHATVPHFRVPFSNEMNFLERTWNFIVNTVGLMVNDLYLPGQDQLMRELFNETVASTREMPYIRDLLYNISLLMTSTHFSLSYPRPYLKNVVDVGGVSLFEPKPLPKELDDWMNSAKEGVILFSWGSHFKPAEGDQVIRSLMETFSKLKQKVLFKWPYAEIPNKPDNVRAQSWVPQTAILNHKNTVIFISHCGLSSIYESAYFGVPVVATPLFGDQPFNSKVIEHFGMGVQVPVHLLEDDSELLLSAIRKVLADPSYKKNALKRRELLRDRPIPPLDEAVYWVEYILRHGGQHLRPPTLPWYSTSSLDVIAFLGFILSLPFVLVYLCCRRCRKPSKPLPPGKKKKN